VYANFKTNVGGVEEEGWRKEQEATMTGYTNAGTRVGVNKGGKVREKLALQR